MSARTPWVRKPTSPAEAARQRDLANRLKENVRGVPGLLAARAKVMRVVRGSATVLDVLDRARGEVPWVGGRPRPMHTDPATAELATAAHPVDVWPVVLVLADHLLGSELEEAVEAIRARQLRSRAFRPVFLLRGRPSTAARTHHYPFDLLSLPDEIGDGYAAYRARRIVSLVDHLGVSFVVRAADAENAGDGLDIHGALLLDALAEHLHEREPSAPKRPVRTVSQPGPP